MNGRFSRALALLLLVVAASTDAEKVRGMKIKAADADALAATTTTFEDVDERELQEIIAAKGNAGGGGGGGNAGGGNAGGGADPLACLSGLLTDPTNVVDANALACLPDILASGEIGLEAICLLYTSDAADE